MIYLDNGATSYVKPLCVQQAVLSAMQSCASPGRGGYRAAAKAEETLYRCRKTAAKLFSCLPEQVAFTENATHALNIAIKTLVKPGGRAVISGYEHNAVVRPLHALGASVAVVGRKLFAPQMLLSELEAALQKGADAVICTHVSNVFGYVLPVCEIAETCRRYHTPFVLDASQSAGILPVDFSSLGATYVAMPGHKGLYGPQGTGILLSGQLPKALLEGGTGSVSRQREMPDFLPDRIEAGTQNVPGIAGLCAGMEFVLRQSAEQIAKREAALCRMLARELCKSREIQPMISADTSLQAGVLSVRFLHADCELAAQKLAERGICVRAGLHCAPLAHESAGTSECGTVRFTPSAFTETREIAAAAGLCLRLFG